MGGRGPLAARADFGDRSGTREEPSSVRRKATGAFYTPQDLADALVGWAIHKQTASVFDPSFGDGSLLRAALSRLRSVSAVKPQRRLHGIEISPPQGALRQLAARGIPRANLLVR